MKYLWVLFAVCFFNVDLVRAQQTDSPETLDWAFAEAHFIDSSLNDAIRSHDQVNILMRMLDAYFIFDGLVHAGLYCTEGRVAAEAGRSQCDLINYYREKDINSLMARSLEAIKAAVRIKDAVRACRKTATPDTSRSESGVFTPRDILHTDAMIVELDLMDGLSSGSVHIISQKLEHAIQMLHGIERLAASLPRCTEAKEAAQVAAEACSRALQSSNWTELNRWIKTALASVPVIRSAKCRG